MPELGKAGRDTTAPSQSLLESEERFRLLVEQVTEYAIFMLDPGGHVASWNNGAERLKGYRADEIIGQHFSKFYPPTDLWKCAVELEAATRDGRVEDEGWRVRKDGTEFWANVVITALRSPNGELIGFAKVTRDMTERRRAEEALRKSEQERIALGQLARERIKILTELSEALVSALTVADVGRVVADKGGAFVRSDTCTIYLLDERTKTLELVAERGVAPAVLEKVRRITADSGNPFYWVGTGRDPPAWIENAETYERLVPSLSHVPTDRPRAQAFWCVPLVAESHAIGMLGVGFFEPRTFSTEEREFVQTFARQCAQALARARGLEAERAAASLAERLRASLATTVRSIGDAVIATDAKGRVTLMNAVAETLTGWTEADAIGRPLGDCFVIVNEHTRDTVVSPVDRVLETGGIVGLANHTVLIARDGRETAIDDSGAPIRAENGSIQGVVLVFRDVTDRKREEARRAFLASSTAALAESLDYEATVAKVARLAVPTLADWCAVDLVQEGIARPKRLAVAHVDPAKVQYAKEIEEKYPSQLEATTGVPNVLRTGRSELYPNITDEMLVAGAKDEEHLRISRELRLHSAMIVPLVANGRVLGAMTFVHAESGRVYSQEDLHLAEELARRCGNAIDNARIYASEQRARRSADIANRAKDEFLAVVSHELRTPLNAIMGWAKMLSTQSFDDSRRTSGLQTIERNSVAMAQLIEDLLDMSRIISGKMRIEVREVDFARVIEAAIESVRPAAEAREIAITSILDTKLPPLMGDPTRLQQIVWNLLSNAVKFSAKGGRVEVVFRRADSSVEVSVSDHGKGIAADFLPHVFDAFRQEDASPSRSRGGLGLGLAITRQLVELHGGRISVESEGESRGSTFTVRLPIATIARTRVEAVREPRPPLSQGIFQRATELRDLAVLVVDDDDDSRELVAMILSECGCRVRTANGVDAAMGELANELPDVLLSDIGMPGQDGYDLIAKVRALPRDRGGDLPAAALTAYVRPDDRRRMLDAGFSMTLAKPIEPSELISVVTTLSRFMHRATSQKSEE